MGKNFGAETIEELLSEYLHYDPNMFNVIKLHFNSGKEKMYIFSKKAIENIIDEFGDCIVISRDSKYSYEYSGYVYYIYANDYSRKLKQKRLKKQYRKRGVR